MPFRAGMSYRTPHIHRCIPTFVSDSGMRFRISAFLTISLAYASGLPATRSVLVIGDEPGPWKQIFGSVGLSLTQASDLPPSALPAKVDAGAIAILHGPSLF